MLLGPVFVKATAGSLQTGKFDGKMIVVESLWDREAMPWQADWYRDQVREHLGAEDRRPFPRCGTPTMRCTATSPSNSRIRLGSSATYGVLQQALRDLAALGREGRRLRQQSTSYRIDDGQVDRPADRRGTAWRPAGGDAPGEWRRARGGRAPASR